MAMQQEFFEAPQHSLKCNPSRARPIDLVHLARSTRGNKETETTVLGLFARQARQCVNQLCETGQGTINARVCIQRGRILCVARCREP